MVAELCGEYWWFTVFSLVSTTSQHDIAFYKAVQDTPFPLFSFLMPGGYTHHFFLSPHLLSTFFAYGDLIQEGITLNHCLIAPSDFQTINFLAYFILCLF